MAPVSEAVLDCDALTLSRRIHRREVSCREVMAATLARIDRLNPRVNAIVSRRDPGHVLGEAEALDAKLAQDGPLGWMHGFPQAPKDLVDAAGIVTSQGSPLFRDFVPTQDTLFVARIRAAGAVFLGKTNTPEWGLGSHTFNPVFGPTGNAYDPALSAGGSSGGAAVAVALGMLPVADGSDLMGSLRNPAAFNNIFGFRPTPGRVAKVPATELFLKNMSCDGPMARTVADLARLLSVMAGPDPRAPLSLDQDPSIFARPLDRDLRGARIGWLGDLGGHLAVEPGILDLCGSALGVLEGLGCVVEPIAPGFSMDELWSAWLVLRSFAVAGELAPLYQDPAKRALLKPEAVYEVEQGLANAGPQVFAASARRSAWFLRTTELFGRFDALALPSAQVFPFDKHLRWPQTVAGRTMDTYHRWMEVVVPATMAGAPAISVPAGFNGAGLPMGLQLIGRPKGDWDLLRLAHAYDVATRWPSKRPPETGS
ncbi:MAG: amidase [Holophaga sp.]|jgi:amidase